MDLLGDAQLAGSWVVANRDMNRGRGLSGRDGYARVLGIDVAGILRTRLTAAPERAVSEGGSGQNGSGGSGFERSGFGGSGF